MLLTMMKKAHCDSITPIDTLLFKEIPYGTSLKLFFARLGYGLRFGMLTHKLPILT